MVCPNCGNNNENGAQFCANCGTSLAAPTETAPNYEQIPNVQNVYQEPYNQYIPNADAGKGFAIASLVLGLVSFLCFPIITGVLGIIFGSVAKKKGSRSGMATAGIVCGIIGLVLWVIMLMANVSLYSSFINL